jgi:hypothetical protein
MVPRRAHVTPGHAWDPAWAMIMETFFLVEEKRARRTLFFQDLCRDQV